LRAVVQFDDRRSGVFRSAGPENGEGREQFLPAFRGKTFPERLDEHELEEQALVLARTPAPEHRPDDDGAGDSGFAENLLEPGPETPNAVRTKRKAVTATARIPRWSERREVQSA
jgi:hypothetical protein